MKQTHTKKETTYSTKFLIECLNTLYLSDDFKKPKKLPRFNIQEIRFIRDLIFCKPNKLVFFYIADYVMNNTIVKRLPAFNGPCLRRLRFLHNYIATLGNAKEAAIRAGFSPKTAKQQGHRLLREIQGFERPP